MYSIYSIPWDPTAIPGLAFYASASIGAIALYARVRRPLKRRFMFRGCAKCKHAKWCWFARLNWEAEWEQMTHEQRLAVCLRCTCAHVPTEACGARPGETAMGQCDHDYEMCVMPAKHKRPQTWGTVQQVDSGKSFTEYVPTQTATEADRKAQRERLRAAGRKPAPPSPRDDEDEDEQDEPA